MTVRRSRSVRIRVNRRAVYGWGALLKALIVDRTC
jgi:hypothetical protein